jgi:hypothetical protein
VVSPDIALALLINRTGQTYLNSAPAYISYTERTHITASIGRSQDINRSVVVRNADDFAVMKDLPNGGDRTGPAFPIIPYFDPFSTYGLSWFANLKNVSITLTRKEPYSLPIPAPDPSVAIVIPYLSFMAPSYAPDSTEAAAHFTIAPTSRVATDQYYPSDVVEDPATHLPSHVEIRTSDSDQDIGLDFKVIEGHWVIVHGTFSATQHVAIMTFKVVADVHYDDITFPSAPADARLSGAPAPKP